MNPNYNITIGSISIDSRQLAANGLPVDLRIDLRLNMINSARIVLNFPGNSSIISGDTVDIALGENGTQTVFRGTVQDIQKGIYRDTVYCQSSLANLVNRRINKLYEKQKAGDLVNDLAQIAGVSTTSVESGPEYPVYALGADRTLFEHILELGRRSGLDCYADSNDNLIFAPYTGNAIHPFQYAANILDLHLQDAPPLLSGVEVYGESPASGGQGKEAYSWLTKQEVKGSAGTTSGTVFRKCDPALKDLDASGAVAQTLFAQVSKTKSGFLKVLGNADIRLGDALQIGDMPNAQLNGTYKITAVKHVLNKRRGFISTIYWTEA
jgi:hypothetical protein